MSTFKRAVPTVALRSLGLAAAFVVLLAPTAAALEIRQVAVTAADIVYDRVSRKLYASVPGSAAAYANCIAVIDPDTGVVEDSVWVGSDPRKLALSDDGQYLYVGLRNVIRRVYLPELRPGLEFGLGSSPWGDPYSARDIAVMPGAPHSVAVARMVGSSGSVAIFDDGVLRPVATPFDRGPSAVVFGNGPSQLFGQDTESSSRRFYRMEVTASGVTITEGTAGLFGWIDRLYYSEGHVIASSGSVVDPYGRTRLGRFPRFDLEDVAVDTATRTAYAVTSAGNAMIVSAYDLERYVLRWAFPVPTATSLYEGARLVAWPGGLALRTMIAGEVFTIDLHGSATLTLSTAGTGRGSAKAAALSMTCGIDCARLLPDGSTVALSATAAVGSAFDRWEGDPDCADGVVTMTGSRSCAAVFRNLTSGLAVLTDLRAKDLAYSALTGKLYASVPGLDALRGNSVTEIDPGTGAIGRSVWVGSEPGRLAVSDDGGTLYVALEGAGAIRRVDLNTLTALGQFFVGVEAAPQEMAVLPGDPDSIAVVRTLAAGAPSSDTAVFTNGAMRPGVQAGGQDSLAFSASPSRLYGSSGSSLRRMDVGPDGVTGVDYAYLGPWLRGAIHFAGGRLYSDGGGVVDPESLSPLGTFPRGDLSLAAVAPDAALDVVYAVGDASSTVVVRRYDPSLFTIRDSVTLFASYDDPASLRVAGPKRVAFRVGGSGSADLRYVVSYTFEEPVFHTLRIESSNPGAEVAIGVSPLDASGGGQGSTPFERTFARGTSVTLTAPAAAGGNPFAYWRRNGLSVSGISTITVTLTDGAIWTAVYWPPTPSVTAVAPASGPISGGTSVTITGTNFLAGAEVRFDGWSATKVAVVNATTITAVTPPHLAGAVSVVIRNADGWSGVPGGRFVYTAPWRDSSGDGKSDVLWRHTAWGEVWTWTMNGAAAAAARLAANVGAGHEIRGISDHNGDGRSEILWRNRATGAVDLWTVSGTAVSATRVATVDPAYDIAGTGDYNGDGRADILWRHTAGGGVWVWLMNGSTLTAALYVSAPAPSYEVAGSGDFDADGKADILWRHATTGELWIWEMNGTAANACYLGTVSTAYQIVGVADFTGDGKADILWRQQTDGDLWIWGMDGPTVVARDRVATVDPAYQVATVGDYNGDARADILWRHSTRGEVWLWLMDGSAALSETFLGAVSLAYQVQSPR